MGRLPKFDYDSDDFYDEILALSIQGLTDAEIADSLDDKFGQTLTPEAFSCMKNGNYSKWSDEENARRSERLVKVLARGRRKTNSIVRGAFLKAALGGKRLKNTQRVKRPIYTEDGTRTGDIVVQETESEFEQSPNIQALSVWLYHHDPEWRKIQRNQDLEDSDIPTDLQKGVDIDAWIKQEVNTKAKENPSEETTENAE